MIYLKALHILFVFTWIGNLLVLTRLLGYHVTLDDDAQRQMAPIYKRMYRFVEFPSMIVSIVLGGLLYSRLDLSHDHTWLALKLLFVMGLVICDLVTGQMITELNHKVDHSRGVKYKILHGVTGLLLIGALFSLYILKPPN